MTNLSDNELRQLCQQLQIEPEFFEQCLQESIIEIHEIEGRVDLNNGTVLRLRQLERICDTLRVDLSVAVLLVELTRRIADLEEKVRLLRSPR